MPRAYFARFLNAIFIYLFIYNLKNEDHDQVKTTTEALQLVFYFRFEIIKDRSSSYARVVGEHNKLFLLPWKQFHGTCNIICIIPTMHI